MSNDSNAIPADDPQRDSTIAHPDDADLTHVFLVGDTYTILLSGEQTAGRMCLIDMYVPPGGGPGPHRHDFEETYTITDGELEMTFRDETITATAGETINIPANAPHMFTNATNQPARTLCTCVPAGQDEFFRSVGIPVDNRTATSEIDEATQKEQLEKAALLAPKYDTELLGEPE